MISDNNFLRACAESLGDNLGSYQHHYGTEKNSSPSWHKKMNNDWQSFQSHCICQQQRD
jgi:hypothetical protein